MSGGVTAAIADFTGAVAFAGIPGSVVERAKIHILDTLGLALAGSISNAARIARDHLAGQGVTGRGAAIFGTDLRAPPRFTAFANAVAIHADNFDDTTPQIRADRTGGIHASGAVLPTVLALGEISGATGREVITAYLVGVEIASRLNHAIAAQHYVEGFHSTGTLNIFGATCAAAYLQNLTHEQTVHAIAIAASRASGIRQNFGSMAEILHPAQAAESGIVAADLAARGLTGAVDALDGPVGYLAAAGGGFDVDEIVGRLGTPWVFENPGVWIKPHPNGALTHPAAGCLLNLLKHSGIAPGEIGRISVRTNERALKTLSHHNPSDGMQAKFSMQFTLSIIALDGQAGLAEFSNENVDRSDVREMMNKVDYTAYNVADADYTNVTTLIDVTLNDGQVVSGRADYARGSTKAPMAFNDVADKFRQCATYCRHPPKQISALLEAIPELDQLEDIASIVDDLIFNE